MSENETVRISNLLPTVAIVVSVLLAMFTGWIGYSNSAVSNDATLELRVSQLEGREDRNVDFKDRFLQLESTVYSRGYKVEDYNIFRDDIAELDKEISILEIQIKSLEAEGSASRADIADLKLTLSKIVTLLKGSDAL